MEKTISSYTAALDELNVLMAVSYYSAGGETEQAKRVADDLFSFLVNAYTLGIEAAAEMLGYDLTVDITKMQSAIFAQIDGKTFEDRAAEHISAGNLGRLRTLAESEFHRVFNAAEMDGAQEFQSCTGRAVMKTWCTMLDERVRDTHDYLEGMSVKLENKFYTFDNDCAEYPGGFSKPENNCGCRCVIALKTEV